MDLCQLGAQQPMVKGPATFGQAGMLRSWSGHRLQAT